MNTERKPLMRLSVLVVFTPYNARSANLMSKVTFLKMVAGFPPRDGSSPIHGTKDYFFFCGYRVSMVTLKSI